MLIFFKGQELRLWTRDGEEYLVLKGINIKGHTYTAIFKKSCGHYQIGSYRNWGHEYKSRFGGDLWESLDAVMNDVDLTVRNINGNCTFVLDQNHLPITDIIRWSVPNPFYNEVEYIIETPEYWTGVRLTAIEHVDVVLEYLLGAGEKTWYEG